MQTQSITATRMKTAGVPLKDARWFLTVGRPNGFKGPNEAQRASNILQQLCRVKH